MSPLRLCHDCCPRRESEFYAELWSSYQREARTVMVRGANKMHSALLTMLLRLRQCCDHFILTQPSTRRQRDASSGEENMDDTDSARVAAVVERSASMTRMHHGLTQLDYSRLATVSQFLSSPSLPSLASSSLHCADFMSPLCVFVSAALLAASASNCRNSMHCWIPRCVVHLLSSIVSGELRSLIA